ncbi:glycosyltransferase family 2 protein [Sphingomonas kyeonggiensis]|uniref:Glycosyltransferase involved in cell wall biosynthesis n=1 Tax=Sphingomonas kyeonggiensis TaxID=1268553 RepID=A0A7W6JRN0_9SPHN|nr:glycosyltransferase family A protein [Sphingomonas kyeonggiensis]MBB4098337.1 glycosyltransferase involved in cell wall biosynthesis [Sphingomonas kyeonggiensis]
MTVPHFSVVMPLYNKAAHVRAAIESALDQSFAPHEILVIDNCSTDGGRELVAAIGHERIKLLDLPTPGPGGYAGRNLGIHAASGDWIAFLDADDLWQPDHLAVLAEGIAADPEVHAAATRFDHVFESRSQPQRIAPKLEHARTLDLADFLSAWLAVRECPMWTGAIAIRRDALFEAGLFPEGRAVRGGDKDLWLRVLAQGTLRYDPRVTAIFHRDSDNKVSKSTTTLDLPCLVDTARTILAGATGREASLLRRLVNQEIAHYARYAMKYPGRTAIRLGDIYLPEGTGTAALLLAAKLIPASIRQSGHALRNRLLARA